MRTLAAIDRLYGGRMRHLLLLGGCLALVGYVVWLAAGAPKLPTMLIWFVAAVVGHDLVLFPLYALGDRLLAVALPATRRMLARLPVSPRNYVRLPLLGAALLLFVYFPGIVRQGGHRYHVVTGQYQQPFLWRWVALVVGMWVVSALVYLVRVLLARRRLNAEGPAEPEKAG